LIGQLNDLGTLGGQTSQARAINNVDQIVGFSETASGATHGFLWQSGAMTDIGPFIGPKLDINGTGKVVGSQLIGGASHAVLWESGVTTDLNSLIPPDTGWLLESGMKINESGLIVGNGKLNGQSHAFLLIPGTLVQSSANLTLTITPSQDPYVSGQLYYDVTVVNNGPDLARRVAVIPSAEWGAHATPSQGSCFENAWNDFYTSNPIAYSWCALGELAPGASATVRVDSGSLSLTASTHGIELDTDTADNRVTRTVNRATADVGVTLVDSPDPVLVGQTITYVAAITNSGPDTAGIVRFTSTTPAGTMHVSVTSSQGSCSGSTGIVCDLGDIASGATVTVTMVVTSIATGTISRTASVTTFATDSNNANNTASASTTVNPAADLAITMTDSPDPVKKRRNLTYTINVVNNGPSVATGVTVTDSLPPDIIFVSATSSQGSCSGTATVTCDLGSLTSGGSANVTIVIKPKSAGTLSNFANVSGNEADPNGANNTATTSTTVTK
ncbi:MAG: hypothetical protein Q7R45_14990, partial [Sulfuricaulis sp.]|nr:hypothetical protein [Sulfuricaulis sp.]